MIGGGVAAAGSLLLSATWVGHIRDRNQRTTSQDILGSESEQTADAPGAREHDATDQRLAGSLPMSAPDVNEPKSFGAPVTIEAGGAYTGLMVRATGIADGITVATKEPVVIADSWIKHERGVGITGIAPNGNVTIRNSVIHGTVPMARGAPTGRAIAIDYLSRLIIENCWLESNGGIYCLAMQGGASGALLVRYNQCRNIDGRHGDGAGGYLSGPDDRSLVQFIQTSQCPNAQNFEVAWNEIVNTPGESAVEDNINLYRTLGVSDGPIDIHHNLIWGAYHTSPHYAYAGGGINCGDSDTVFGNLENGWVRAHRNRVAGTTNYGICAYAGHNITIESNRIVVSNKSREGMRYTGGAGDVGIYVWNGNAASPSGFDLNDASGNWSRYWREAALRRNDWWLPDCEGRCSNTHGRPLGEVLWDDELTEWQDWWSSDRVKAGVSVGPSGW